MNIKLNNIITHEECYLIDNFKSNEAGIIIINISGKIICRDIINGTITTPDLSSETYIF